MNTCEYDFDMGCKILSEELANVPQKKLTQAMNQLEKVINGFDGCISWHKEQLDKSLKPFRRAWIVNIFIPPPQESKREEVEGALRQRLRGFTKEACAEYEKEQMEYWGDPAREDEAREELEALERRELFAIEMWENQGIAKSLRQLRKQTKVKTVNNNILL